MGRSNASVQFAALWRRNDRYYAQLAVEDPHTGINQIRRVPLEGVTTDAQTVAKLQELLTHRRKGALPVLKRTPRFADYATQYFDYYAKVKDAKRPSTLATERIAINHWEEQLVKSHTINLVKNHSPNKFRQKTIRFC